MISIVMCACATQDEAALAAEQISKAGEWEAVLTAATTDPEAPLVICAFMRTTPMDSASDATAACLETSLVFVLDSLAESAMNGSPH